MSYRAPVHGRWEIVNGDGSHYGWMDYYFQPDSNGKLTRLFAHYRVGAEDAPPDTWGVCPVGDATNEEYESSYAVDDGQGGSDEVRWRFEDPLPDPHPAGAVGWIDRPGQPRRWLIPA